MREEDPISSKDFLLSPFRDPTGVFSVLKENPKLTLALYAVVVLWIVTGLTSYMPASRTTVRVVGAEPSVSQTISSFQDIQRNPAVIALGSLLEVIAKVVAGGFLIWAGAVAVGGRLPVAGAIDIAGAVSIPEAVALALKLIYYVLRLPDSIFITIDMSGGPFSTVVRRSYSDPPALGLLTLSALVWEGYLVYLALTSSGGSAHRSSLIAGVLMGAKAFLSVYGGL